MKTLVKYSPHYRDYSEGHIYLDKVGACTITLTGAAAMTQAELDEYGAVCADALNQHLNKKRTQA